MLDEPPLVWKMKLYWLDHISPSERALVGEKAWALSQLKRQGYPVVHGLVIEATAFWEFLRQLDAPDSWLADFPNSSLHVNPEDPLALQLVAQQAKEAIAQGTIPAAWLETLGQAIASWQTQAIMMRASLGSDHLPLSTLDGLLPGQVCPPQQVAMATALQTLWGDFFSAHNLYVWQHQAIAIEHLNFAVLIQPLQDAVISGCANFEPRQIGIQATNGLGRSLVQGEIQPDTYVVERRTGDLLYQQLGQKMQVYRLSSSEAISASTTAPRSSSVLEPPAPMVLVCDYLGEEQRQHYALSPSQLGQLIALLQQLQEAYPGIQQLEWLLTETLSPAAANLQITQCDGNLQVSATEASTPSVAQPDWLFITQGLAASPGIVIAPTYLLSNAVSPSAAAVRDKILVAQQIEPAWLPLLKQAAGIVTVQGGLTSHAAIIARELGIPAIVGTGLVMEQITAHDVFRLDGDIGNLYRLNARHLPSTEPSKNTLTARVSATSPSYRVNPKSTLAMAVAGSQEPETGTYPSLETQLMVNLSQGSSLATIHGMPVDGIGLLRSELMLLDELAIQPLSEWVKPSQRPQFIARLTRLIKPFAIALSPRPIYYRLLDPRMIHAAILPSAGSDVLPAAIPILEDDHLRQAIFAAELEAMEQLNAEGFQNLHFILPLVRSLSEFNTFYGQIQQSIQRRGLGHTNAFQCWIMAEIPSVIFLLDAYQQLGLQGISIGTNDLTQLLLGVTRSQLGSHCDFNAGHPAVKAALQQLVTTARSLELPCSICGQAPVDFPELIDALVHWGIHAISVEPGAVEQTYQAIAQAERHL